MKRRIVGVVALVVVALVVWWWRRDTSSRAKAAAPAAVASRALAATTVESSAPPLDEDLPPPHVPEQAAPAAPIIDDIVVEKREICEGEESLVTVRAHTPGHTDDTYLHYLVAGDTGASVPIVGRHRESDRGEPAPETVMVFGRGNVATTAPMPEIIVKDCMVQRRVEVHSRLMPNTTDEFELYAQIVDLGASTRMKPVSARWTFGDGTFGESKTPLTSHDYGARAQTSLYSQFLVEVEVTGADGEKVRGRTALQLMNPSFEHLKYRGLVLLRASLSPRFPELDAQGKVVEHVHVWHDHDEPVTILRVLRRVQTKGATPDADVLAPGVVFPSATVGRRGIDATVELDTRALPDAVSVEYVIEGVSADGLPAQGGFSVMRPPPRPTRENSDPVQDPALVARILRARQLLQQEFVTDEDLWKLEKEGAFADLPPTAPPAGEGAPGTRPAPPAPPAPPPGTPPPPAKN